MTARSPPPFQGHRFVREHARSCEGMGEGDEDGAWLPVERYKVFTLVFLIDAEREKILLGLKKRGFGAGLWNGFGGKVEPSDKSAREAAVRELLEEASVRVRAEELRYIGRVVHVGQEKGDHGRAHDVRVFVASRWEGVEAETEEMAPRWYGFSEVPFQQMWPDDRLWCPLVFSRTPFAGRIDWRPMLRRGERPEGEGANEEEREEFEMTRWWFGVGEGGELEERVPPA